MAIGAAPIACTHHERGSTTRPTTLPTTRPMDAVTASIRDEGLNHSQVMKTLDYLCNVIGARLTGSPACKQASQWTRDTLATWGLADAHLEAWGPFGRGWTLERFSMQITSPSPIILHGYPRAWSPGFDSPLSADVVYLDAQRTADFDEYRGKLEGKIVLLGVPRDVDARFEPLGTRLKDGDLEKLAAASANSESMLGSQPRTQTSAERRAQFAAAGPTGERLLSGATRPTTVAGARPVAPPTSRPFGGQRDPQRGGANFLAPRALQFAADEGAAMILTSSLQGDGGTIFVQSAIIPSEAGGDRSASRPSSSTTTSSTDPSSTTAPTSLPAARRHPYDANAPTIPPQVTLAVEDYNRLVHMIKLGQSLKVDVDLKVKWNDDDEMSYNTVAEIPGSDLNDEVVMVGAHLDSWHSGTGATDNGVGAASAMEAVRILQALHLHPRRTIRVALWTGEEEGLFGSTAYVKKHFGSRSEQSHSIAKLADYEKLSAYFNLDNGTGKIRGIYAQGNADAVPIFKEWLAPFGDLGATTVSLSNTGSTDHIPFDSVGLPGFQFIQDPIEYFSRTHHSNEDVYDRAQADDLKQASTIMASFLWDAANLNKRFPRKVP